MKKKILIADDEIDVVEILEKKFIQSGFEVITALNGDQALRKCKEHLPDAAVLDIMLGDIDGFSVASSIRQQSGSESIPIIFMTAKDFNSEGVEKRLSELENCYFINKPCSFEELLVKISELLSK
ncbi:MAG: response regulator transcription factor [Candidatus Omnitrophica bacterium]|jgi:DNA-binding response OmpR family regulator|nr:response regulator transcription factor [Candidatus Omnitrophota bacterium]